jgi:hypothetical protein
MTYPPVIQFETRALHAEAWVRLARERAAAKPAAAGRRRLLARLPLPHLGAARPDARVC